MAIYHYPDIACLSTDVKPSAPNGSTLIETDTGLWFTRSAGAWTVGSNADFPTRGSGCPTGGTAGQVLSKIDATDFNSQWVAPGGGGGNPIDAWPVGSIFIAVVATSPATLLGGGTWVAFGAGRVLVGINAADADFDTAEETGGAKTHTLTAAEMPAHTHPQTAPTSASGGAIRFATDTNASGAVTDGNATGSTGGGGAHNNVQPYVVVYMWKRTA